jgi:hypothetical protein
MTSVMRPAPSLQSFLWRGSLGFGLASVCVFATVAFAEQWMYRWLGLAGAYLAWTALFILLGGGALTPLIAGSLRALRFYGVFALAFFAYAAGWVGAYFSLGGALGEWIGALAGCFLMSLVFAAGLRALRSLPRSFAWLFVASSLGYFLGSALNGSVGGKAGMMLWGAVYGSFMGAGLGAVLFFSSRPHRSPSNAS